MTALDTVIGSLVIGTCVAGVAMSCNNTTRADKDSSQLDGIERQLENEAMSSICGVDDAFAGMTSNQIRASIRGNHEVIERVQNVQDDESEYPEENDSARYSVFSAPTSLSQSTSDSSVLTNLTATSFAYSNNTVVIEYGFPRANKPSPYLRLYANPTLDNAVSQNIRQYAIGSSRTNYVCRVDNWSQVLNGIFSTGLFPNVSTNQCFFTAVWAKDSDSDRIIDWEELNKYKTNPYCEDTDGDGRSDYAEISIDNTNPNSIDSDGDGIPDGIDENPSRYDGDYLGQNANWVNLNFISEAAAAINRIGYAAWVDSQIGYDQTNGLYRFAATFDNDPELPTLLEVGDLSVVVTNAGSYVFLCEKGREYSVRTAPYNDSVRYDLADDLSDTQPLNEMFARIQSPGTWSVSWGAPYFSLPTLSSSGKFFWLPGFRGYPDVTELHPNSLPLNFSTLLLDAPPSCSPTYRWLTDDLQMMIATPAAPSTEVSFVEETGPSVFSLVVEAEICGETLRSEISPIQWDNRREHLSVGMPDTLFVDDDDDNDDGNADSGVDFLANDDVASAFLSLSLPRRTSGVLRVDRISPELYITAIPSAGGEYLQTGDEWNVINRTSFDISMRVASDYVSSNYEDRSVVFRWVPDEGDELVVTNRLTVVRPVVEPICSEMVNGGGGSTTDLNVLNPSGIVINRPATYKIDVLPADYPNDKIVWTADDGSKVTFPNGDTGRIIRVRGAQVGDVNLIAQIGDSQSDPPQFKARVVNVTTVNITPWIIANEEGMTAVEEDDVYEMVNAANEILSQVGVFLAVDLDVVITNLPYAYHLRESGSTSTQWDFDRLIEENVNDTGIVCYFVNDIVATDQVVRPSQIIRGITINNRIALSANSNGRTMAHEIGHVFGLDDIYVRDSFGNLISGYTNASRCLFDWNGGCVGHGISGTRYYHSGLLHSNILRKLLMNGRLDGIQEGVDVPYGSISGIGYDDCEAPQHCGFFDLPHNTLNLGD